MPEERKLVTVLFADVTGSTALGEELDPEDVRALMGRYYDHAKRVVSEHGGRLEKFIGDAVMAVFGLPHAHGDDAERAVAAALALQRAVAEDVELEEVMLRIGLNTGEVVATTDPSARDFLVTGDAVNVAARLQQCANPGEILASERTYAAAGAVFVFGESRQVEVKGKREPPRVFPVAGRRAVRQTVRPPMVGREDDLLMLSLLHRRVSREGRPQLVSIVAPAGTGKTRLLEEFLARIEDIGTIRTATCRCLPYGQTLTFWPLRGLTEELLGGIERQRVVEIFQGAGHTPEDAERLADLVLATLGFEGETLTERESIFAAWRLLAEALAQQGPLIVIFEDLHWASESLLDLVEQIMHPRSRAPLLLIAISRPELLDRRPAWGAGARQNITTLALEPLPEDQTEELVGRLGPELPPAIRRKIVERSGGNPFFVTELVRGLAERGTGDQGLATVPDTVHAAVLARLDLLEPTERRVLQAAAVGGRLFRPAIVQAVLEDVGSGELDAAIDDLLARDLIIPDEGGAFTFRHLLIRDVAYGTLSRAERARMHLGVATWLEEFAQDRFDEYVELIAYHYREALLLARRSASSSGVSVDAGRAMAALERAGEIAGRAGAASEARGYLESAIALAEEEDRGRLYEKLGDSEVWGERALAAYRGALARWRQGKASEPGVGARLLRKILVIHLRWFAGVSPITLESLIEMREEAQRLATEAGEVEQWRLRVVDVFWPQRRVYAPGGAVTVSREEHEEHRATALAAAAYFEERGEWEMFSAALDGYMFNSLSIGRWDDVLEGARRRLAAPQLPAMERGDALHMMAWAYWAENHNEAALGVVWEAIASIRPGDPIGHLGPLLSDGMFAAYLSGRWSEVPGIMSVAEDIRQQDEQGEKQLMLAYIFALAAAVAREDLATADVCVATLRRLTQGGQWAAMRCVAEAIRADDPSLLDLDPKDGGPLYPSPFVLRFLNERGIAAPDAVMSHAETQTGISGSAARFLLATARAIRERDAEGLAGEIDLMEAQGLVPDPARLRIVLAEMTGDPAPLEQARPVLERLQDRQFLRRLEEVRAYL